METGFCGEQNTDVIDVDYSEEELLNRDSPAAIEVYAMCQELAIENADSFGHGGLDDDECVDEDGFEIDSYENVYATWEIYDPEIHNDQLTSYTVEALEKELAES